jgi:branched-chain amino acid transport system permease protein
MKKNFSLGAVVFIVGLLLPLLTQNSYFLHLAILMATFGLLASYWNMLDGYLGLIHFGYAAFFGLGAYTSAILATALAWPLPLSILCGGVMSAGVGILVIIPCLRMGVYSTSIVTLAFGEIMRIITCAWTSLTKGEMGLWGIPPLFTGNSKAPFVVLVFALLAVGMMALRAIIHSPLGLAFTAIRDDEIAANTTGVPTNKIKVLGTGVSCFAAGIVGAFYAHYILTITPDLFGIAYTIQIMAMSMFGGKGTLLGPLAGAVALIFMGESFRFLENYRLLIYGVLMIATVMVFPEGLVGLFSRGRKFFLNQRRN